MSRLLISLVILLSLSFLDAHGQLRQDVEKHALYKYEQNYYLSLRSSGWGFGYRTGKFINGYKKRIYDFNFSFTRDLKQKRTQAYGANSFGKPYYFGIVNNYYVFRALRGNQTLISQKPYWGGVELRKYFLYGLNTGISKPVYHYIDVYDNTPSLERYDPEIHDWSLVYGRGPYKKGLSEVKFHPGLSLKAGLDFEFGSERESVKTIELGMMLDGFVIPYQSLGSRDPSYYLFSIYFSFHFGKRYNK